MLVNIVGGNKTIRSLTQSLVDYCADKLNLNDSIILDGTDGAGANKGDFLTLNGTDNSSTCLLYTSPSPRDATLSRMPSSA